MLNEKITEEEILLIKRKLISSKSAKRRSAAKKIGKYRIISLRDELLEAYIKEREDIRTWETQTKMITALGKVDRDIGYEKSCLRSSLLKSYCYAYFCYV